MKKLLAMMMVLMMVAGCALAEGGAAFNVVVLEYGIPVEMDLNGDGAQEFVTWRTVEISEYEEMAEIRVNDGSGAEVGWGSEILYGSQVQIADIDGDGLAEILVTGDQMSDDYITYCLHYTGTALQQVQFVDGFRGENVGGYFDCGYGRVDMIGENTLVLTGSQDMLGTYMMSRVYTLQDGRFEFADDGLWRGDIVPADSELWEYRALVPTRNIAVSFIDAYGATPGILQAGEKAMVISFDKVSTVYFMTQDGREGYFTVEPDPNNWGSLINGIPEAELFSTIPYAD